MGSTDQQPFALFGLQNLNLYNTGLTGFLPKEMSRLTTIQFISLGNNKLEGGRVAALLCSCLRDALQP